MPSIVLYETTLSVLDVPALPRPMPIRSFTGKLMEVLLTSLT